MASHTMLLLYCVLTVFVLAECCTSRNDCGQFECCVTNNPPRGKRFLSDPGHCVNMGKIGNRCYTRYGSMTVPPPDMVFACPCGSGLTCKGQGIYEVPLGEVGVCSH